MTQAEVDIRGSKAVRLYGRLIYEFLSGHPLVGHRHETEYAPLPELDEEGNATLRHACLESRGTEGTSLDARGVVAGGAKHRSRRTAWATLQRLRKFLEANGARISVPDDRSFETEGEVIESGLRRTIESRDSVMHSLIRAVYRSGMPPWLRKRKMISATRFRISIESWSEQKVMSVLSKVRTRTTNLRGTLCLYLALHPHNLRLQ